LLQQRGSSTCVRLAGFNIALGYFYVCVPVCPGGGMCCVFMVSWLAFLWLCLVTRVGSDP
jgi:hypothetical protein